MKWTLNPTDTRQEHSGTQGGSEQIITLTFKQNLRLGPVDSSLTMKTFIRVKIEHNLISKVKYCPKDTDGQQQWTNHVISHLQPDPTWQSSTLVFMMPFMYSFSIVGETPKLLPMHRISVRLSGYVTSTEPFRITDHESSWSQNTRLQPLDVGGRKGNT